MLRSLKDIEQEMCTAALNLDKNLFREYWTSVKNIPNDPKDILHVWLELADHEAKGKSSPSQVLLPSKVLFKHLKKNITHPSAMSSESSLIAKYIAPHTTSPLAKKLLDDTATLPPPPPNSAYQSQPIHRRTYPYTPLLNPPNLRSQNTRQYHLRHTQPHNQPQQQINILPTTTHNPPR